MRREHLIPIIRLATHSADGNWANPKKTGFMKSSIY